jgi:NAD(P)-dependent dehydrogenase (short-subunit alcohol dehydrogenase family)
MSRFKDKVCIVTGGGSGIGKATCVRMANEGGHVVVVDLNPEHGNAAVEEIKRKNGDAIFAKADVGKSDDVQRAVQSALDCWKRIDVLVNDAAMMTFKPLVELAEHDWDHVLNVNLKSVFLFCKHSIPHMPKGSAIVNISSVHAHETEAGVSPYVASKGAMEALTRSLAIECEKLKIRANCVAPGAVNTPMLWNNPFVKSGREKVKGAVGEPEDIAAAVCFLASSEARFVNGTTLIVDGARLDIL